MSAAFCTQQFPKLWSAFVDHFVDFGYTGQCCATQPPEEESVPTTGKLSLPAAERLVAIGDLHGDLEKAQRAFQLAGVADAAGNWVGGHTVCVQLGDILDRGDDEIKIFYYLEKLQQQAKAAGGQLHVLNGNHETLTTAGYHRYATRGSAVQLLHWHWWQDVGALMKQRCATCTLAPTPPSPTPTAAPPLTGIGSLIQHFTSTAAASSSADAPAAVAATTTAASGWSGATSSSSSSGSSSSSSSSSSSEGSAAGGAEGAGGAGGAAGAASVEFRGYLQRLQELELSRKELQKSLRMNAFGPGQSLAKRFLAPHPTVLQVGGSVFVHGGILPHHVEYGLDRINRETSTWLQGAAPDGATLPPDRLPHETMPQFLSGSEAIVWARDYSRADEARCDCTKLQGVLGSIPGACRMVVGHTIQPGGINAACEEQVLRVDVGLSRGCGDGDVQVLEITDDRHVRRLREAAPAKPQPVPGSDQRPPPAVQAPFWQQAAAAAVGAARA